MELSALRILGLVVGVGLFALTFWRRRALSNGDALLLLGVALALIVVSTTPLVNAVLDFFDFREGGGRRVLGLTVFATLILFLLNLRAFVENGRNSRTLSAMLEGIASAEFRSQGLPERFRDKLAVVIPAHNESESLGEVLERIPETVCGVETATLVLDDGSRDATGEAALAHGASVVRHVTNRGQGAALRTGYFLMADAGARLVVTLDADGQHLPEEMNRVVEPVLRGEVDVAQGSRVLGAAASVDFAREVGHVFFNRLLSVLAGQRVTDCANGYRAVRAARLPELVLRQDQFHSSEFLLEAIKRGVPFKEVPVTVVQRLHGRSRKPASLRYGIGFSNAIMRTWLRAGFRPDRPV